ncbi:FHIPEP family type III secretion protein [Coprothermobacteraceae bacterium]|nr:FHIPEP family type III secretion protein [Coprothermobacteraceae bacterium]
MKGTYTILFVVLGIFLLMLPVPSLVLDVLFALNLVFSLLVLMIALYTRSATEFSSFPSLMLFAVFFHLVLIISSARAILVTGNPGSLATAFGRLIMGQGSWVVGLVVFIVLLIVQYMVITSGQQRISEVAARFTLDAMPGRQMAIDADLSAGFITPEEARRQREMLRRESDFFGAMDGASRFVRGEAMASALAALVNSLGGMIVGLTKGQAASEALLHYLSVSMGVALQIAISSLALSLAAALLVARVSSEQRLGEEISGELMSFPPLIRLMGGILIAAALLPGVPKLLLIPIGAALIVVGRTPASAPQAETAVEPPTKRLYEQLSEADAMMGFVGVDPIELEFGYELLPLFEPTSGQDVLDSIALLRKNLSEEFGFPVPGVRIHDNLALRPDQYRVKVRGAKKGEGHLQLGLMLAMGEPDDLQKIAGIDTKEPVFNLDAKWISPRDKLQAEAAGLTVVDAGTVIVTHLGEVVKANLADLITRQNVKDIIEYVGRTHPAVVDELQQVASLGDVEYVFKYLLQEQLPLKDVIRVLELVTDSLRQNRDLREAAEQARRACVPYVIERLAPDSILRVVTVKPDMERALIESYQQGVEVGFVMSPDNLRKVVDGVKKAMEGVALAGEEHALVTHPRIRRALWELLWRQGMALFVLSYNEIVNVKYIVSGSVGA